jgi:hypothetical protein
MNRKDDPLADYRRALEPQRELQNALRGLTGNGSLSGLLKPDPFSHSLTAKAALGKDRSTFAVAEAARCSLLAGQIKAALETAHTRVLPTSTLSTLKIAGDLGTGTAAQAAMAAYRGSALHPFATGGAVAEALRSVKALSGSDGVLAGLLRNRDRASTSAMRQIQSALGMTGALISLGTASPFASPDTFSRASQWSVAQSLMGGTVAEFARNSALSRQASSSLMDAATRTAADGWRTVMDGVMGTTLAGLRPSMVSTYAGLYRSSLPLAGRASDFALGRSDAALAGHLADQMTRMRTDMSEMLSSLGTVLEASRQPDASPFDSLPTGELAAAGADLEAAMAEVARTGTLDALLRFIDHAFATFAENTRREIGGVGAVTLLAVLVSLFQIMIWIQPAWTPQPDATPPPGIERVHQAQHELSGKFDDLTAMLARHEADNLGSIPRGEVRRPARVRTGPGTAFPMTWRLEPGEIVGMRDREAGWTLVFYRDPLSGVVGSGWVYSALLEHR